MNRRSFLQTLTAGAVGLTLDPERLLWVPGARKLFIPSGITFTEDRPWGVFAKTVSEYLGHGRMSYEFSEIRWLTTDEYVAQGGVLAMELIDKPSKLSSRA